VKELLQAIVNDLVTDASAVEITVSEPVDGLVTCKLHVAAEDMGRVIGKQGKIAKAIRTIMRAGAAKEGLKVNVDIE
jgi:predicted RNA-binding protein YlqC (UPF0109 family)